MINLLFLTATALASDVYEICALENQVWNEENQSWATELVTTFYTFDTIQFIVHENSFEVNRKKKNIQSKKMIGDLPCFIEHENSFFCLDEKRNRFLWEFYYRNGKVTRDVLKICGKNGE
tara:strand:+ start:361 stop:720 length:360 start_codon:yes stop_codon:yes gene_type:complete